jgi:hypothetical protein
MSFAMENLGIFRLRGRASMRDGNLLANGPFVLWGSYPDSLVRGDFYGPDGKPVVSVRLDPAGALVYFPRDGEALFSPGGIPAGEGVVGVRDVIRLIRTGYPSDLEQWQVADGAVPGEGGIRWTFLAGADTLGVSMDADGLFPREIRWTDGAVSVTGSTWHDEYRAWPGSWLLESANAGTEVTVTELVSPAESWPGLWDLNVPVQIDTLAVSPAWSPGWDLEIR